MQNLPMTDMSLLNVESLSYSAGDKPVWKDASVRLSPREHVALIGRNGVGKSTLLRILAGQLPHDAGRVEWLPGARVGYLTQQADLPRADSLRDVLRGAFARVFEKERQLHETAERMATAAEDELDGLLKRYARLSEEIEQAGIYELDARIETVAAGLGLPGPALDRPVADLSGGQRTRLVLSKLLLEQPDAMLLDEPTNHLDAEHVDWLAGFLQDSPSAFVVVSHDEAFITRIAGVVWSASGNGELLRYDGSYPAFLQYAEQRAAQHAAAYRKQQDEISKMETFVQKNIARASTTRRAQSRRKQLEKIDRIPPPAEGVKPAVAFRAERPPARVVLKTERLQVGYRTPLLPPLDWEVKRGQKIALVGCNGIGKSTFLRTILGEIRPFAGRSAFGEGVRTGYFAQEAHADPRTPLDILSEAFPAMTQREIRSALARTGLRAEHVLTPLRALSGGEQVKVRLNLLLLRPANVLLLDEPTNHLDVSAKGALQSALAAFPGTVLLVSHEPDFYRPFATDLLDIEAFASGEKARPAPPRRRG